jgi:hypothetical protein
LPDPRSVPADVQLLVDEARIGCASGMLLCLDREQRLIYILGEIFGVIDQVGAELLEISRENFRQKLTRARRDLHRFMQNQCGLINKANPFAGKIKVDRFDMLNPKVQRDGDMALLTFKRKFSSRARLEPLSQCLSLTTPK